MASGPTETDLFVRGQEKVQPTKWQAMRSFFYNSKEGTVLGRTGKSWLQITVFYLIFYGVLAAFFSVLLILFLQTLDENAPKWKGAEGIIGSTPGMGFRPLPDDTGSTLLWLRRSGQKDDSAAYVKKLNDFLLPYENQQSPNLIDCSEGTRPTDKQACRYDLNLLGPCNRGRNYGYSAGQPCVLIKLNKIYGWEPQPMDNENMNKELSESLTNMYGERRAAEVQSPASIVITCEGEDPVDREHIGPVRIHPPSIPAYYYPFLNQKEYLQPVAMLEFLNPKPGVVINVECRAWAGNIEYNRIDKQGALHFELMVER